MNKPTKEEILNAIQACINTYEGRHGTVVDIFDAPAPLQTIHHTQWLTGKIGNTFYIAFQGSSGTADWFDNFKFWKVGFAAFKNNKKTGSYGIKVHAGFDEQADLVWADIFNEILNAKKNGCTRFIITGHSLGAAIATLISDDVRNFVDDCICLPFESPRVGNYRWKRYYNTKNKNTYRFRYHNDIVCKVPTPWMFFNHIGKQIYLGPKNKMIDYIKHPIKTIIGDPMDHYPQLCLQALQIMGNGIIALL